MADRILVRDKETHEVLMIIEGDAVEYTEAYEKKKERKKKSGRDGEDGGAGE